MSIKDNDGFFRNAGEWKIRLDLSVKHVFFLFVVLRRDDIPDSKLDRVWRKYRKKCILGKLKERLEKV